MSKDNFKNQKKLTQKELDAIDNYDKPLKPQPELPSGGMGGKKGGVVKKKIIKAQIGKYMNEDKQREEYRKRLQEYQEQQEVSRMPRLRSDEVSRMPRSRSDEGYISDADREYAMRMRPMENLAETLSPTEGYVSEAERRMMQDNMPEMKKGGMTKGQKKVGKVMSEFKEGKLKSSSGKKVTNPKQAIAIGLSEAGMSNKKMMNKGGMVRGQGIAIRGTKFKGIF